MNVTALGIDLAKKVFQLHGIDKEGKPVVRKRLMREELQYGCSLLGKEIYFLWPRG
ncbi:MAG: hypothetical protein K0R24_2172 [Gammaproteobacteria bacterium]|nr:hypothetical protein [Gammaproteobacteria bacterium]